MSTERIAELVGELTDRKTLLARAGAAGLGSMLFVFGARPKAAEAACFEHGCFLCDDCTAPCPPQYLLDGCAWCWLGNCHTNPGGSSNHRTWCCEGYNAQAHSCVGDCGTGWLCSFFGDNVPC
jgi:hypothetical protein